MRRPLRLTFSTLAALPALVLGFARILPLPVRPAKLAEVFILPVCARRPPLSITIPFLAFIAVAGIADILGPGHQWGSLAAACAWFLACRSLSPRGWRVLLAASLALSVAIALLAVAQMWAMPRARGPFASPNLLGAYAVLMFFLSLGRANGGGSEARKPGYTAPGLYAAANLLSLALSQSRGAILALGAVLLYRWSRSCALLTGAALVLTVALIRPDAVEARWGIWRIGLQAASQRLLLGWGQGGLFISGLGSFYSIPLEWLINAGILGVLAGTWLLIAAAKVALKEGRPHLLAFLTAWFVQGLFLYGALATYAPLIAVLAYLASDAVPTSEATAAPGVDAQRWLATRR